LNLSLRRSSSSGLQISISFSINGDAVSEATQANLKGQHPMTYRLILSVLALGAVFASTAPAFAQDEPTVHVKYGDLNLNSAAGVQAFHQRLQAAVISVCGKPDHYDMAYAPVIMDCQHTAWAGAEMAERKAIGQAGQAKLASTANPKTAQ
jgi:UrcA family protein